MVIVHLVGASTSLTDMKTVALLNPKETILLKEFKESIKDCVGLLPDPSDDYVLKWLVARNFNLDQAEKMLRFSLEWRKANAIDGIVEQWQPPVVLLKYYPMSVCGLDKFFCPVSINAFGRTDWRGILQSVSKRDFLRYICYLSENNFLEMKKNSLIAGRKVSYQTFIIDMEHLSMRQMAFKPTRDVGIELTKMAEQHYPEIMRRVFIINAPRVFTMVFAMIRPLLHQATTDKIKVFGTDREEWSAALLQEIDADQLPVHYGGTLTGPDGDRFCSNKIRMGGIVPDSYYLSREKPKPKSHMTLLTLPSGSLKKLEFPITCANSILKYEFMTEDSDIMFHVYYLRQGEKMELISAERVDSHLVMEEGQIVCTDCCTYVIVFDNSYSYLRSKKVWYDVVIEPPISEVSYEDEIDIGSWL